jgi:hypothetical protein
MHWIKLFGIVAACTVATSFTDWLFMGVLFHNKYLATPEIWRGKPGESETNRILASTVIGFFSCGIFIVLCRWAEALTPRSEIHMAGLVWLAVAVPIVLNNILWTKMHPLIGVSHSLGWLVRFVVTGLIAGWMLG